MKKKKILIVLAVLLVGAFGIYLKSCTYFPIEGTVIDAETKQPIEGAVILAEWTITPTAWIGLPTTYSYKVIETISDKNGKFNINTYVLNPIVNKPNLTIYKAGYVCWNNSLIFPGYTKRDDYTWENGYLFRIDKFKPEYTHDAHVTFIRRTYSFGLGANSKFEKTWDWEASLALEEIKKSK